ncbi:MAG: AgmX/PglI C-terminal domain-containing protein [Myxococcota bacterium]
MSRGWMLLIGALLAIVVGLAVMSFMTGSDETPVATARPAPTAPPPGIRTSTRTVMLRGPAGPGFNQQRVLKQPFGLREPGLFQVPRPGPGTGGAVVTSAPSSPSPSAASNSGAEVGGNAPPPERYGVSPTGIRSAVQASLPELKECYEEWLKADPKLEGAIAVGFRIRPDPNDPSGGKIDQVEVQQNSIHQVALEGCILNVFSGLHFERPVEPEVKVTYPLNFANK